MKITATIARTPSAQAATLGSEGAPIPRPALIGALLLCLAGAPDLPAADRGAEVVVIYNSAVPESKSVAEHYAGRRGVPSEQVLGFDLPTAETVSRKDYLERLEKPLLARLESLKLFTFGPATNRTSEGRAFRKVVGARIRYAALCYGVPVRILRDEKLAEPGASQVPPILANRNEAAVDSQLAIAPLAEHGFPWTGPVPSPFFGATNAGIMHPTNGLLIVTRLDGPSAAIARGLVDKALEAETNGLWGRAYFDARRLATNDSYYLGDVMMRTSSEVSRRIGFETVLDERPETFPAGFPMSQIAFYSGWYDQVVSGPFTRPKVEFMPGAIAYHLYSFNASTVRTTNSWVGTLLDRGATCTFGSVDEPYLTGTPEISYFLARFAMSGFTFGQAAYAAQPSVSWQTTVIGDPLYAPFARTPDELLADLQRRKPALLEWYYLVAVNQKLASGASLAEAIGALEGFPAARKSAVLTEKLADLYWARGSMTDSIDTYEVALKRGPSEIQRQRLLLSAAEKRVVSGPDEAALAHYRTFLKENPDHPDRLKIYQAMLPLAKRRNLTDEAASIEAEIKRLSPAP